MCFGNKVLFWATVRHCPKPITINPSKLKNVGVRLALTLNNMGVTPT